MSIENIADRNNIISPAIFVTTGTTVLTPQSRMVTADTTGGDVTIRLPDIAVAPKGLQITVCKIVDANSVIVVDSAGNALPAPANTAWANNINTSRTYTAIPAAVITPTSTLRWVLTQSTTALP